MLETFIIQALTEALLHPVKILHAILHGISTRDYHRPNGYKLPINYSSPR